ncbi:MAG: hypothetical protein LBE04_06850, partial [Prevotellaceae bacterium]|nr:hypothetical protein [Prevotellaceae bacterium]
HTFYPDKAPEITVSPEKVCKSCWCGIIEVLGDKSRLRTFETVIILHATYEEYFDFQPLSFFFCYIGKNYDLCHCYLAVKRSINDR